ncbi:MAG: hypothetical protein WDW36_005629 [Sanguina aurantia]
MPRLQAVTITNTNQHPINVLGVAELKPHESFAITSQHPLPLGLDPGVSASLTVTAASPHTGMLRTLLVLRCSTDIVIVREAEICVDAPREPGLPDVTPKSAFIKLARPSHIPAVEVVKAEKPVWALSSFARPPAKHQVPAPLRALLHGTPEPGLADVRRAVRAWAGMAGMAGEAGGAQQAGGSTGDRRTASSLGEHVKKMHALLFVEELQQETNIRTYDMGSAQLCKNLGKLLWLEVPGLAGSRPSVMQGDSLFVRPSSSLPGSREWEGRVYEVQKEQRTAVQYVLMGAHHPAPYIVFGPPGTGKTSVLVEAALQPLADETPPLQLLALLPSSRLLLCAPSNSAADQLATRLLAVRPASELLRINAYQRSERSLPAALLSSGACPADEDGRLLICQGVPAGHFTHVLADEAGHAEEPLCLGPMAAALGARVVLAGSAGPQTEGSYNPVYITKLLQNYRSHPDILSLPSRLFYSNELLASADPLITNSMFPLLFHAVVGEDTREGHSPSWFNVMEAKLVLEYVLKLKAKRGGQPVVDDDIGVITPYCKQVQRIRTLLAAKGAAQIKVGSVEEFQGQERRIMIISTVRSSAEYIDFDKRFQLGFVANPKGFNVAITRAKAALIIIGNPSVLASDIHWRALLNFIQSKGGCKGSAMPDLLGDATPEEASEHTAEDLAARMDCLFLGGPSLASTTAAHEQQEYIDGLGMVVSVEGGEIPSTSSVQCNGPAPYSLHLAGAKHRVRELRAAACSADALHTNKGGLEELEVRNSNRFGVTLLSISTYKPSSYITITPAHTYPVHLPPKHQLSVTVRSASTNVGILRSLLVISCITATILRRVEVCVTTAAGPDLPSIEPTSAYQQRAPPSMKLCVEIVRSPRPRWAKSAFPRPCARFEVPPLLRDLLHSSTEPSHADVCAAVRAAAGMSACAQEWSSVGGAGGLLAGDCATAGTIAGHLQKIHAVLFVEELQQETDIRFYDMESACFDKASKASKLLFLEVPGLAENRPSVLRGDALYVRVASSKPGSKEWEGRVDDVQKEKVGLRFDANFHNNHVDGLRYHVRFKISRLMHEAATILSGSHLAAPTLLPALYMPAQGWVPHKTCHSSSEMASTFLPKPRELSSLHTIQRWYKPELNDMQRTAVQNVFAGAHHPFPYIVFGPPGTGKTSVLVEAALQLLAWVPSSRLLLCAPSNSAADQLASRMLAVRPRSELMRVYAYQKCSKAVPPELLEIAPMKNDSFVVPLPADITRPGLRCVIATCQMSMKLTCQGLPSNHFTHVLIDEAGHAVEPLCLAPMATSPGARVIIAGDPKQLGPPVMSKVAVQFGLKISLLERLTLDKHGPFALSLQHSRHHAVEAYNPVYITKLLQNYRSHPSILSLPNKLFYGDELMAKADPVITGSILGWEELPNKLFPLLFHAVVGEDTREGNSPSWFNVMEAKLVLEYVLKLKAKRGGQSVTDQDIGVITPYRKQAQRIRTLLAAKGAAQIKVGSVEEFQGQERRIIVISTVRSSAEHIDSDKRFQLGFVANPKRFNVAITRAKAALVIIGNPHVLASDKHWRALLHFIQANGGCKGSDMPFSLDSDVKEGGVGDGGEGDLAAGMERLMLGASGPLHSARELQRQHTSQGLVVSVEGGEIPRWI